MLLSEWSGFQLNFGLYLPARAGGRRSHGDAARLIVALGFALIRRVSREGKSTVGRDCRELLINDPPLRGKDGGAWEFGGNGLRRRTERR